MKKFIAQVQKGRKVYDVEGMSSNAELFSKRAFYQIFFMLRCDPNLIKVLSVKEVT
jgi:hypothetical protein